MPTLNNLPQQMAEKSEQELKEILSLPADWTPEALAAATAELQKRGFSAAIVPPPPLPNTLYEILPDGRKRFLKATGVDIIFSIILPFWGLIIGAIAFFVKGEKKRGATMMIIGAGLLLLIVISKFE